MKAYELTPNLEAIAEAIAKWAEEKGFWKMPYGSETAGHDLELLVKSQKIALMHSELSELLEELRKPEAKQAFQIAAVSPSEEPITNEEVELADLIIRALDYAGHYRLRIGLAIGAKMAKNEGRPYMHGKNF